MTEAILLKLVAGGNVGTLGFWMVTLFLARSFFVLFENRAARLHKERLEISDGQWERNRRYLEKLEKRLDAACIRLDDCEADRAELRSRVELLSAQE